MTRAARAETHPGARRRDAGRRAGSGAGRRATFARAALAALLAAGCAAAGSPPGDPRPEADDHPLRKADDGAAGPEARVAVRPRLSLEEGRVAQVTAHPFSHRGRRHHLYPLTLYAGQEARVTVTVSGAEVPAATLWIYGPMQGDGSWGAPRRADGGAGIGDGAGGAAALTATLRADDYGQWAVVVGPSPESGFAPRYPSSLGTFRREDGTETLGQLAIEGAHVRLHTPGESLELLWPEPGRRAQDDPAPGDDFIAIDEAGDVRFLELVSWSASTYYMPAEGEGFEDAVLGNLHEGVLSLHPTSELADEERTLVLWAMDDEGRASETPARLAVVPETHEGRAVAVRPEDGCDGAACRVATFEDDGSPVPEALVRHFQPTHYDFDERSTYDLVLECLAGCEPDAPAGDAREDRGASGSGGLTRHPVYFAHGFNSRAAVWDGVRASLAARAPAWSRWCAAMDAPPLDGVPERTEQLRRNLQAFVGRFAPAAGERFVRVNVVAHSMGGLDARRLVLDPQYNERCAERACTDASGAAEACCASDTAGRPVPWRERIVSVTTLSTPHGGSSFADFGVAALDDRRVGSVLEGLLGKFFGLGPDARPGQVRYTLYNLSNDFARTVTAPSHPLRDAGRGYDWACATGERRCAGVRIPEADAPVARGGALLLPAPEGETTFYSWGAQSCLSGSCGDVISIDLAPAYAIVRAREGSNDGVVATDSARFGIYMGLRPNDHFRWNRLATVGGVRNWLFGNRAEPADRFHLHWLDRLAAAGY